MRAPAANAGPATQQSVPKTRMDALERIRFARCKKPRAVGAARLAAFFFARRLDRVPSAVKVQTRLAPNAEACRESPFAPRQRNGLLAHPADSVPARLRDAGGRAFVAWLAAVSRFASETRRAVLKFAPAPDQHRVSVWRISGSAFARSPVIALAAAPRFRPKLSFKKCALFGLTFYLRTEFNSVALKRYGICDILEIIYFSYI